MTTTEPLHVTLAHIRAELVLYRWAYMVILASQVAILLKLFA